MRALSLKQPWAELILRGEKTIETRTWNTRFRGPFLIHASRQTDADACRRFGIDPASVATGAILGSARLAGTKRYANAKDFAADDAKHRAAFLPFTKTKYGFLLEDVRRVRPRARKGRLGFFEV